MNEDLENEILVSRFVDGEMAPGEEDAFLAYCEAEPAKYRDVALAFIERERWNRQCVGAKETPPLTLQNVKAKHAGEIRLRQFAVIAASLVLGLTGGYLWNQSGNDNRGVGRELPLAEKRETPLDVAEPSVEPGAGVDRLPESGRIPTTYANYQENDEAISTLISAFEPEPLVPEEGVQQLRESGLVVEENTKLYVLELSDGRHLAVPTQFVRFSAQ